METLSSNGLKNAIKAFRTTIYLFKVNKETLEKGVKYVQS